MPFSFTLKNSAYMAVVLGGLTLTALPVTAHAGFEWTPPPAQQPVAPPQSPEASQAAIPSGPLTPEPDAVTPAPVTNVDTAPVSAPATTKPPVVATPATMAPETTPVATPVATPTVPSESDNATDNATIEGFGKDIPLALALRDIVPSSYAYVFTTNDIAGTKISWRGGKPWQTVLQTALAAKNLQARVTAHIVEIGVITSSVPPIEAKPQLSVQDQQLVPTAPTPLVNSNTPVADIAQQDLPPVPVSSSTSSGPTPTAPALPVVDLTSVSNWHAKSGTTLRDTLDLWSKMAHVELVWSTTYDYPVNNAFSFKGTFSQAVDSLLASYNQETSPPKGRLHPNLPNGPSVLIIN